MFNLLPFPLTADISDASDTKQLLFECPFAGRLNLEASYLYWTEATGTQTTTEGVIAIEVNDVEVATLEAGVSLAIGQSQTFTIVDGAVEGLSASNPYVTLAAGDIIGFVTKTQAVDGTITGDGTNVLALEWAV